MIIVPAPPQGGDRAVHHGHGGCHEETEDVDGSEEGAVRLRCQVSQVGCCKYNYCSVSHLFLSFIVSTEKGRYYEGEKEDEEDEYYEV